MTEKTPTPQDCKSTVCADNVPTLQAVEPWSDRDLSNGYRYRDGSKVYCCAASAWEAGHSDDCASKRAAPLQPAAAPEDAAGMGALTPANRWRAAGEPDPYSGRYYDGERAALAMGNLTDDELANGAFLNYDVRPPLQDIIAGKAHSPIAWMTAVKDRIRWLSRSLEKALAASSRAQQGAPVAMDLKFHLRIARLLAELHGEEYLSEQQCARYMGIDLVSWRKLEHCFSGGAHFVEGESEDFPVEDSETVLRAALAGLQAGRDADHSLGVSPAGTACSVASLPEPQGVSALRVPPADADESADALRFRWLCEHPDWHFIERLCREFVADSSVDFLAELRRVIDVRRSIELGPFESHSHALGGD